MSDITETLRKRVLVAFNEYRDYVELVGKQNETKRKQIEDLKKIFEDDNEDPDIKDFSFEVFLIDGYHRRDMEYLEKKFYNMVTLYKEIPDYTKLDDEIEDTFKFIKENNDNQVFYIEKNKFKEINKGFIEERKKYFEDNNLFDRTKEELEKILK